MMIGIDTPLGYWLGMIVAFLAASALSRIPFLRKEELLPEGRHVALDGLRGLLAPAVVFHHMFLFRQWQLTGEWSNASGIYTLLGPIPVAIFFMLTGFLFWEKAIRADGQIHAWSLYKGRIYRIVPLYSLLVLAVVTLTVFESGFRVSVPRGQLLSELTNAFSMGARILGSINGSEAGTYAGTATWTLTYEWRFYVLLPLMAYLSTLKRNAGWLLIAPLVFLGVDSHQIGYQAPFYCALLLCGIISIWFRSNWWLMLIPFFFLGYDHMYLLFAFGMLSAHLSKVSRLVELLRSNTISLIVLLVVPLIWWTSIDPYSLATESLCFIAFLPIACGNSLFGILRITGLRTLGTISYSIYLIHCLVLYLLYRTFQLGPTFVGMNSIEFWISMAAVMVLVVIVSIVTFRYFELPFMIMGRKSERPEAS